MADIPPSQIKEINKLLLAYSAGEYHKKGRISPRKDKIDSIILGVNLLGEELLATTVSRDFFSSIYNAVADMLFVVNATGKIKNSNNAAEKELAFKKKFLLNKNVSFLLADKNRKFFTEIKKELKKNDSCTFETNFISSEKKIIPVSCVCSKIFDRNNISTGYLFIAEDITERKATEQRILRAVVDTQEKEQKRVSKDLHDSLGQELSAMMMYINSLRENPGLPQKELLNMLDSSVNILENSRKTLRNICFDLMPASLEDGCIVNAINELLGKLKNLSLLKFHFYYDNKINGFDKPLEIVMYRIIQEFISNSIKHSGAENVQINLLQKKLFVELHISDDGCGFLFNEKIKQGRGLSNIASRIKAFNGTYTYKSKLNGGTILKASFPVSEK